MWHCAGKCLIVLIRRSPADNYNENCCVGLPLRLRPWLGSPWWATPCRDAEPGRGADKASDSGMELGVYFSVKAEFL